MTDRWPEIRVSCPAGQGFIIWQDGEPIAALTSRSELADWIENALGDIPGEREREAKDLAAVQTAMGNVERFPNIASPRSEPRRSRLWGAK
jgi:hypothetical protein